MVERIEYQNPDGSFVMKGAKRKKTFRQKRPDPDQPGGWVWDTEGVPALIYRLPEITEAIATGHLIAIVEGEGKADLLWKWGVPATCCPGGAERWKAEHSEFLRGADVVILPDNDLPGRKHVDAVARSLAGIAASVRILELPDLPPKGDIVDWAEAGHTRKQLDALIDFAQDYPADASTRDEENRDDERPSTEPREQAERKHNGRGEANPGAAEQPPAPFNAEELDQMRFDPIKFVVPGYIVEGLTLFAGKPKIGKSWLLLHAAIAVARGGFTLGDIHCAEGDVLYCALEDNKRRLRSRMSKLMGTSPWPRRLQFTCEMSRLAEGGLDYVKKWIAGANQPRLVVIDVLAMVRMPNRKDLSSYDADYQAVKELRALAHQYGVAIVLVHHLRKAEGDDVFDTISGTLGLTGAPDTIMVIKRTTTGATLHARGRDLIEIEKAVQFNATTCAWTVLGDASEVRRSGERSAITNALAEAGQPLGPNQIATACGMKAGNVRRLLSKMKADNIIKKASYGKYTLGRPRE